MRNNISRWTKLSAWRKIFASDKLLIDYNKLSQYDTPTDSGRITNMNYLDVAKFLDTYYQPNIKRINNLFLRWGEIQIFNQIQRQKGEREEIIYF